MDWNIDMPTIITLFSLVMVVIFFGYEQRQLRKQMMIQNFSDYTSRYRDVILNLPLDIMDADFDLASLKTEERERCLKWMRVYFDLCAEEFLLFRKRMIDKDVWTDWLDGMRYTFNRPAFRFGWDELSGHGDIYSHFKPFVANEILVKT